VLGPTLASADAPPIPTSTVRVDITVSGAGTAVGTLSQSGSERPAADASSSKGTADHSACGISAGAMLALAPPTTPTDELARLSPKPATGDAAPVVDAGSDVVDRFAGDDSKVSAARPPLYAPARNGSSDSVVVLMLGAAGCVLTDCPECCRCSS